MKPIFRNSMFGFDKGDVASFISKQSKIWEKKVLEAEEKVRQIEQDLQKENNAIREEALRREEELRREMEILEEKNRSFQDMEKKKQALLSASVDAAKLREEIFSDYKELIASVDQTGERLEEMKQEHKLLQARVAKGEIYREKAEKFDQLASALSGMVGGRATEDSAETFQIEADDENVSKPLSFSHVFENLNAQKQVAHRFLQHCEELQKLLAQLSQAE